MSSTRTTRHINAPRAVVYRALLDARAVAKWRVPTGMTSRVHEFDAREGGSFRVSLTYDAPTATGKTTAHTDTYHGTFVKLVPSEQVVEVLEFESTNPEFSGKMTITTTLADAAAAGGNWRSGPRSRHKRGKSSLRTAKVGGPEEGRTPGGSGL